MLPGSRALHSPIAVIEAAIDQGELLAGAVTLVASRDKILDVSPAGLADNGAYQLMAENTLFWIASQTKPITATALLMLVDEGRTGLDDPVERYLPEFAGQMYKAEEDGQHRLLRKPAHAPTIREVLSHTGGLPFDSPLERPARDGLPLRVAARGQAMMALESEPGSRFAYSHAGFSVAGRLIEVVSGMAYEDFLQARIFDPLDMIDTTFWPTEAQAARLARTYRPGKKGQPPQETLVHDLSYPLTDRAGRHPFPGGGLFSTARDCAKFCRLILNDGELDGRRYVSAGAVREMTRRQTPAEWPEDYGLGWQRGEKGRFGHGGELASHMEIDPGADLATVFLAQIFDAQGREAPLRAGLREYAAGRYGKQAA